MRKTTWLLFGLLALTVVTASVKTSWSTNLWELRDKNGVFTVAIDTPTNNLSGVGLDASAVNRGSLSDARLSANVALLDAAQAFSGVKTFTSTVTIAAQNAAGFSLSLSSGVSMAAGTVNAGWFVGNGSGLTNVTAANVAAANVTAGTFGAGVLLPTNQLSGTVQPAQLVSTTAYTSVAQTFTAAQRISAAGGLVVDNALTASSGTFTNTASYSVLASSGIKTLEGVTAGYYYGDGSHLTGIVSGTVAAGNITPGTFSIGDFVFPSSTTVNGLLIFGAVSGVQIIANPCTNGRGRCWYSNTDDGDIYTSTGTNPGGVRNSRTGTGLY